MRPLRRCPSCQGMFEPDDYRQEYCNRACGNRSPKRRAKMRTRTSARQVARLTTIYGPLSERDKAIWLDGHTVGYQRGYHQARRENRRDEEAA